MLALTREVSAAIARCELTHAAREPIDLRRARHQHAEYERALETLGCTVRRLPAGDDLPDSVFIEDTAVVLPEVAILARPGAPSRRGEVDAVAAALEPLRPITRLVAPATLDGGDVIVIDRAIYVGLSSRTNREGIDQLRAIAAPHGYSVLPVVTSGCLHLKSAATALDGRTLLLNPQWVSKEAFAAHDHLCIDPSEPGAANTVGIDGQLIVSAGFPRTCARLEGAGFRTIRVDASELAKAEGALTCCSLLVS
ncbi:MAG TPA: hypothetical protein VM032_00765 [Vicinamibacterales bacterium]|nr:hypothetical protein [Vicinamibacterales bacterium]